MALPLTIEGAASQAAQRGISRAEFDEAVASGELHAPQQRGNRDRRSTDDTRCIYEDVLAEWLNRR